jgi:hypothetical protein
MVVVHRFFGPAAYPANRDENRPLRWLMPMSGLALSRSAC